MSLRVFAAVVLGLLLVPCTRAGSSNSLMDVSPDGKKLLVTNSDNGSVSIVDTVARKVVHEVPVGDKPEGATWVGNGPLAVITVYRDHRLAFVDTEQGKVVATLDVPPEPYGIVATRDGKRAYVTHEYPGLVTEIDLEKRTILRQMKAGSMVRGIALAPDEKRVYVTEFYTAWLHALDLASGKVVDTWKGSSSKDNLARHVELHPTRPKAYVSHIRSRIEVIDGNGSIFPHLTIYTLVPKESKKKRSTSIGMDTYNGVYVVTNPWEAAISPDGKRLYTIYAGTNDMNVSRVIDDDYQEIDRIGFAVRVGQNPRAVRVSPDGQFVYILNALDFTVTVHDPNMRRLDTITVCAPPKTPEWVRGKILFNTANRPLTRQRWIACSSCHPDGHPDGRVWNNPEGMRKTPALMGLAHTHPLHWSADRDEVQDFEYTIRGKLMGGRGLLDGPLTPKRGFEPTELKEKLRGRSRDLDDLAIYTNSFTFTLSPHIPAPGKLSPAAERGKALFFNKEVACASCHKGPYYTDSSLTRPFNLHDVGTGEDDPGEKIGARYDTPTLLGVYRTAPYLHHGKAKTLHEVLTTCNKGDKHGKTSHLRPSEIDDLVAFLKSLPYEMPPDTTPNTVEDRIPPKRKE
jgi:YVTN family beta-propeller protein